MLAARATVETVFSLLLFSDACGSSPTFHPTTTIATTTVNLSSYTPRFYLFLFFLFFIFFSSFFLHVVVVVVVIVRRRSSSSSSSSSSTSAASRSSCFLLGAPLSRAATHAPARESQEIVPILSFAFSPPSPCGTTYRLRTNNPQNAVARALVPVRPQFGLVAVHRRRQGRK